MAHLNTFLSLACRHVKIGRYGQERLLIVLGTSQYFLIPNVHTRCTHLNTFLSLACGYVELEMYDQERLLIVPGTSQCFLIPSV